ncbi:hypothetical protein DUNSADRAFT_239 [Dunaliella salina]|uniref:Encoded protein n=1 Tax=Dunaliella salina TaxID=3046 RepID=A0ABQ7FZC5_DUNSA|nr:hypothetical protein DUNSADRAFT_239 [Dunaliella salina]|eukprot:KAF5827693.1 hypothetical protein DUNSADRAFT_239 [Dunaliella salina]
MLSLNPCQNTALMRKSGAPGRRALPLPVQRRRPVNTRAIDANLIATLAERTVAQDAPNTIAVILLNCTLFICVSSTLPIMQEMMHQKRSSTQRRRILWIRAKSECRKLIFGTRLII